MVRLQETLAFVTVVDAGSFTAAGKRLGVPKSTLSEQVRRLENRIGARLLHRTTRKLSLTETGRAYFERCRPAIEDIADAERVAQDVSGSPRGLLRISSPYDFGRDYLRHWIVDFRRAYPDLDVEVIMSQRRLDMLAEGIDVALRGGMMPDSTFVSRKLLATDVILVASPDYLARRGRPKTPRDLVDHDAVLMPFGPAGLRLQGPEGDARMAFGRVSVVANEWMFLRTAQVEGLGVGPNLETVVKADIDHGRLERILPDYAARGQGFYAVYPSRHHLSPKVRVFVDFIADSVAATVGADAPWGESV